MHTTSRVAWRWLTAKPKYLKAIDFTIGLIRRLEQSGSSLPGASNNQVLRNLVEMRKAVQSGFRLDTLADNKNIIKGKGTKILRALEKEERELTPKQSDVAAFIKPFPDKTGRATERQGRFLEQHISNTLDIPLAAVEPQVMANRVFMMEAFAACTPVLAGVYSKVVSDVGSSVQGTFEHRIKAAKSAWGKQGRAGTPFYLFRDLIGCRAISKTLRGMASSASSVQSNFEVVRKTNYYLQNKGYNAINYVCSGPSNILFEYQIKTEMNNIESAISHDLVYAPEKAIVELNSEQKELVSLVIDISTQLSMRDWADMLDVSMKYGDHL